MKLTAFLLNLLFPPKCVLCGRLLGREETDFCHSCRADAPVYSGKGKSIAFVASWTAVWYYEDAVRDSLLRYKFRNAQSYAGAYGRVLAMRLLKEREDFDLITWVPISDRRRRKRGYDQVALIAQTVGSELGMPPQRTLRKIRHTPPQSSLDTAAQRKANVLGAYAVVEPQRFAGKRVLLLDDIITTGATVSECARVLLTAGAKEVICAAVAATRHQ